MRGYSPIAVPSCRRRNNVDEVIDWARSPLDRLPNALILGYDTTLSARVEPISRHYAAWCGTSDVRTAAVLPSDVLPVYCRKRIANKTIKRRATPASTPMWLIFASHVTTRHIMHQHADCFWPRHSASKTLLSQLHRNNNQPSRPSTNWSVSATYAPVACKLQPAVFSSVPLCVSLWLTYVRRDEFNTICIIWHTSRDLLTLLLIFSIIITPQTYSPNAHRSQH